MKTIQHSENSESIAPVWDNRKDPNAFGCTEAQKRLAQHVADGMQPPDAARLAGCKGADREALSKAASKQLRKLHVRQYLEYLQRKKERGEAPGILAGDEILQRLSEIARDNSNKSAGVSALRLLRDIESAADSERGFTRKAFETLKAEGWLSEKGLEMAALFIVDDEPESKALARAARKRASEAEEVIQQAGGTSANVA